MQTRDVQELLKQAGYYNGQIDGDAGRQTMYAVAITESNARAMTVGWPEKRRLIAAGQRVLAAQGYSVGKADGIAGPRTARVLHEWREDLEVEKVSDIVAPVSRPVAKPGQWPTQAQVRSGKSIFGKPGTAECTAGSVLFPVQMEIAWQPGQMISSAACHRRAEDAFTSIFAEAVKHYGERDFRALGLDQFGGCFNHRNARGGSALSMHAWGIAIDLDPLRNGLKVRRPIARLSQPDADAFWRIVEAHGAVSLGRARGYDFMHMQLATL